MFTTWRRHRARLGRERGHPRRRADPPRRPARQLRQLWRRIRRRSALLPGVRQPPALAAARDRVAPRRAAARRRRREESGSGRCRHATADDKRRLHALSPGRGRGGAGDARARGHARLGDEPDRPERRPQLDPARSRALAARRRSTTSRSRSGGDIAGVSSTFGAGGRDAHGRRPDVERDDPDQGDEDDRGAGEQAAGGTRHRR